MKQIKIKAVLIGTLSIIGCLLMGQIYAQETTSPAATGTPVTTKAKKRPTNMTAARNPESSYLDIFHAKDHVESHTEAFKKDLLIARIMVANFGSEEDKKDLTRAEVDFKDMLTSFYSGKYIKAEADIRDAYKALQSLYDRLSDAYQNRATEILAKCTEKVVEMELSDSIEPGSAASSSAQNILKSRVRLNIAYNKLNEAENQQVAFHPGLAINQFRLAKLFGVAILEDLAETEEDKKKIRDEYAIDLKDIQNLIANKSASNASETSAPVAK